MAKIRDKTVTEYAANTLVWAPEMPVHVSGDLLLVFIAKDGNTGFTGTPSGWDARQTQASAGAYMAIYSKVAASAAESFSIQLSTTDTGVIIVIAVKDVYTGGEVNVSGKTGSDDTAIPFAGVSGVSTTQNKCLVFHMCGGDSGLSPTAYAPAVNIYAGDATNGSLGLAYVWQETAGAITQLDWFGRGNDDTRCMVIAVRSNDSGAREGYSDPAISVGQVIRPLVGLSTMQSDSWPTSLTFGVLGNDWNYAFTYISSSYADVKAAVNSPATGDVTLGAAVGDMLYLGSPSKFESALVVVSTAGIAGVMAWEYYDGASWVSTGITGSNLTSTGAILIKLSPIAVAAMSQYSINSVSQYWIRARVTTLYTTAIILTQSRENGRATSYIVSAASADNGTNPYCDGASNAGAASVSALAGFEHQFGASVDLDTGILFGTFRAALKRDIAIDAAKPYPYNKSGGLQITLADASGFYASYSVHAKLALSTDPDGRNVFAIDWNGSAVAWGLRDSMNKSAVTRMLYTSYGYDGAVAVVWSMLSLVTRIGIAGGSSSEPLTFVDLEKIINNCVGIYPFFKRSGSAAVIYAPLQFGGGDRVCVSLNLNTFQFPRQYDGMEYFDWNVAENVAGIKFYPKSGDVLNFTNCVFTSESSYRWEFDVSSASSGWTGDFSGSTIVKAAITLREVFTFDRMTFINCTSFTQNGAAITNGTFSNTKITSNDPANISDCAFVSGGTGHAIEITTPGTYAFDGNTFSGYGSSGTDNAAIYNNSSGEVTLNITGGDTPTVKNGSGASTILNNMVPIKVTVKDAVTKAVIANARVYLVTDPGNVVIFNHLTDVDGEVETTYNYTSAEDVVGRVRKSSGSPYYKTADITGQITSAGYDLTVLMIRDDS